MNNIIKIGTLNTRNNDKRDNNLLFIPNIIENIKNENFDVLGTQELTKNKTIELANRLKEYNIAGKYRFGNLILSKIPIFSKFNENNCIITRHKIIYSKTKQLPWIPYNFKELKKGIKDKVLIPRIVTISIISINNEEICFINTHLSNRLTNLRERQLCKLIELIKKYSSKYEVILTGDFNTGKDRKEYKNFVKELKNYNLKDVELNERTHHLFKTAIDHIFVPSSWKILESGIITNSNLTSITDHKEVYVIAKIKED